MNSEMGIDIVKFPHVAFVLSHLLGTWCDKELLKTLGVLVIDFCVTGSNCMLVCIAYGISYLSSGRV
jgi:hypothetical protein